MEATLKSFLAIVGGGLLLFMVVAIAQEWDYFAGAWLGRKPQQAQKSGGDEQAAADAVRRYVALVRHLHASGGDPRFAERIPASPEIVAQEVAEAEFLRRRGEREDPQLMRLDVREARVSAPGRVEVHTKEYWVIRRYAVGNPQQPALQSQIVHARYLVALEATSWRVTAWNLEQEPATGAAAPPGG